MAIWTFWWLWFHFTCVECPVSWAAFSGQCSHTQDEGSSEEIKTTTLFHVSLIQVYSCLTESNACLAPTSLRYLVTLVPSEGGENFSEVDLGSVFSHQKLLLRWSYLWAAISCWKIVLFSRDYSCYQTFVNMCLESLETAFFCCQLKTDISVLASDVFAIC